MACIDKYPDKQKRTKHTKPYLEAIKELEEKDKLSFVNYEKDTLYILSSLELDYDSFCYVISIWNQKSSCNFKFFKSNQEIINLNYKPFQKGLYTLIENWDQKTIKLEGETHQYVHSNWVFARKIILKDHKLIFTDSFEFLEFFNPKYDRP